MVTDVRRAVVLGLVGAVAGEALLLRLGQFYGSIAEERRSGG
jgi:uncharacterized membrane protein YeaQ/YmgE (transglycosylase-associated protein family)